MGTGEFKAIKGTPAIAWNIIERGVEIFLVDSCYKNRDYCTGPGGSLGSYADFIYLYSKQDYLVLGIATLAKRIVHEYI